MPSNHKRHAPARTAHAPAAESAPPAVNATPEPPNAAPQPTAPVAQAPQQPPPQPPGQPAPQGHRRPGEGLNITDLKDMSIQKLTQIGKDLTSPARPGCGSRT